MAQYWSPSCALGCAEPGSGCCRQHDHRVGQPRSSTSDQRWAERRPTRPPNRGASRTINRLRSGIFDDTFENHEALGVKRTGGSAGKVNLSSWPVVVLGGQVVAMSVWDQEGVPMAALQKSHTDDPGLSPRSGISCSPGGCRTRVQTTVRPSGPRYDHRGGRGAGGSLRSVRHIAMLAIPGRANLAEAVPGRRERWRMRNLVRAHAQRLSDAQAVVDGREHGQGPALLLLPNHGRGRGWSAKGTPADPCAA